MSNMLLVFEDIEIDQVVGKIGIGTCCGENVGNSGEQKGQETASEIIDFRDSRFAKYCQDLLKRSTKRCSGVICDNLRRVPGTEA